MIILTRNPSFVSQRFDWIESCSSARRPESKSEIQDSRRSNCRYGGILVKNKRQACCLTDEPRDRPRKRQPYHASCESDSCALRHDLEKHVGGRSAQCPSRAEFTGSLFNGHPGNTENSQSGHDERARPDPSEKKIEAAGRRELSIQQRLLVLDLKVFLLICSNV